MALGRIFQRIGRAAACAAALSMAVAAPIEAKTDIKAAMVYNIVRFVEFPSNRAVLNLCIAKNDPMAMIMLGLEGRPAAGGKLDVIVLDRSDKFGANCQIIYMDNASPGEAGPRIKGQIVIGAGNQFAENGGMVGLIRFGGQTRFVLNLREASARDLRFSSQLIQLSAKVIS